MSAATDRPTAPPPRPAPQADGPDERQAEARPGQPRARERFRATARQLVTQLDIEQTMWQILGKRGER